jgi:predicted acyl esterase
LLLPQILRVFSVVAPCQPGAALRNPLPIQRIQATSQRAHNLKKIISLPLSTLQVVKLPVAALLFATLVAAQAPTPAPEVYPVSVQTNVRVKMRDGVSLVADIYRPKAEGKLPVLLTRTPYNRRDPATAMYLSSHG